MNVYRIQIKFYLESGQDIAPETWFRVFNTWIPVTTDEVLVDVADYSHVVIVNVQIHTYMCISVGVMPLSLQHAMISSISHKHTSSQ